ncbi:hypothetical protein ACO0QE_003938 [Hanseniaspora vineae]
MIELQYMLLLSRQGKTRMIQWYDSFTSAEKQIIIKDVTALVLSRKSKMCNIIECNLHGSTGNTHRVIYKRYASLYFIAGITTAGSARDKKLAGQNNTGANTSEDYVDGDSNELLVLEAIHRYVEALDSYFGNVRELDIIFNFEKAYHIMHEMFSCNGSILESSKNDILSNVAKMDQMESVDNLSTVLS